MPCRLRYVAFTMPRFCLRAAAAMLCDIFFDVAYVAVAFRLIAADMARRASPYAFFIRMSPRVTPYAALPPRFFLMRAMLLHIELAARFVQRRRRHAALMLHTLLFAMSRHATLRHDDITL